MPKKPPDDFDPFGLDDDEDEKKKETINAFEIDEQGEWLRSHGWEPGDLFPIHWRGGDPNGDRDTEIPLPDGNWNIPETWSNFYDKLREFYDDIWGEDGSDADGYGGEATGG